MAARSWSQVVRNLKPGSASTAGPKSSGEKNVVPGSASSEVVPGSARLEGAGGGSRNVVPGSASTEDPYEGSRRKQNRFEYSAKSSAGFVELHPKYVMSGKELFDALEATPEVERDEWQPSKLPWAI